MTTVCVLCDPPREGESEREQRDREDDRRKSIEEGVLSDLTDTSSLSESETTALYTAMLKDICCAVETSGGDLLVNYRPDENGDNDDSAEAEIRAVVRGVLDDPDAARFERQVGETFAGRAGNTATHLLKRENVDSVAIVEPSAVFLTRQRIDGAAMKLRRSSVVLGPSPGGRVYYAGFTDPIDYADAYAHPAIETLTDRARDVKHEVDFIPMEPFVETESDLADAVALIRARQRAGRSTPPYTTRFLDDLDLLDQSGGGETK